MIWETVTLPDGRERHHAKSDTRRLSVYDGKSGRADWYVYDATGDNIIASGKCESADSAKTLAENA